MICTMSLLGSKPIRRAGVTTTMHEGHMREVGDWFHDCPGVVGPKNQPFRRTNDHRMSCCDKSVTRMYSYVCIPEHTYHMISCIQKIVQHNQRTNSSTSVYGTAVLARGCSPCALSPTGRTATLLVLKKVCGQDEAEECGSSLSSSLGATIKQRTGAALPAQHLLLNKVCSRSFKFKFYTNPRGAWKNNSDVTHATSGRNSCVNRGRETRGREYDIMYGTASPTANRVNPESRQALLHTTTISCGCERGAWTAA